MMKVKWILIALFVAEIVVYTAFEQYYLGGKFLKSLLSREQENVNWFTSDRWLLYWQHPG